MLLHYANSQLLEMCAMDMLQVLTTANGSRMLRERSCRGCQLARAFKTRMPVMHMVGAGTSEKQ